MNWRTYRALKAIGLHTIDNAKVICPNCHREEHENAFLEPI